MHLQLIVIKKKFNETRFDFFPCNKFIPYGLKGKIKKGGRAPKDNSIRATK